MPSVPAAPVVAFSMGDPNGIGPEVLLKALAFCLSRFEFRPRIFGDPLYLKSLSADLGVQLDWTRLDVVPAEVCPYPPRWGREEAHAGRIAVASLGAATRACRDEGLPLLVTPPISKAAAHLAGGFPSGQTEYIGSFFEGCQPAMAFFSDSLKVVLATVHMPLREVPQKLTSDEIVRRTRLFRQALQSLGLERPRIAVCGLNPHASEGGLFGDEEERILKPALEALAADGQAGIEGPFPPDTVFRRALVGKFDGVVALYHDQGLIPLKLVAFDSAVNVSLGLPMIRTSPDHGTAFDIAGRNLAKSTSMAAAIEWGLRLINEPLRGKH